MMNPRNASVTVGTAASTPRVERAVMGPVAMDAVHGGNSTTPLILEHLSLGELISKDLTVDLDHMADSAMDRMVGSALTGVDTCAVASNTVVGADRTVALAHLDSRSSATTTITASTTSGATFSTPKWMCSTPRRPL